MHKYINPVSIGLILIVNLLFFYKLAFIHTAYPLLFSALYASAFLAVVLIVTSLKIPWKIFNGKNAVVVFSALSVMVVLYILFIPRMGNLGRLPAIEDWINRFANGQFPYNSPIGPSSFPLIFLLAYPFYLLGNTGLLSSLGIFLLLYFILLRDSSSTDKGVKLILLFLCITAAYEIATRSELIFNVMLVVLVAVYAEKYLKQESMDKYYFITALLTGLVLSTRSITAMLFMIYYIYRFRNSLKNIFLFGAIAVLIFLLILLPFYFWDPVSFIRNGPFALQSNLSNLPVYIVALLFTSAGVCGFLINNIRQFYFSGGIILFISATLAFTIRAQDIGLYSALINDGYDITYFIFSIPLLLLSLEYQKPEQKFSSS